MELPAFIERQLHHRILPRDELLALVSQAKGGDRRAADLVVRHTAKWVASRVMKFKRFSPKGRRVLFEDLYQIGLIAVTSCIEKFEPARFGSFLTLATHYIDGFLHRHVELVETPIRVPVFRWYQDINAGEAHDDTDRGRALRAMRGAVSLNVPLPGETQTERIELLRDPLDLEEEIYRRELQAIARSQLSDEIARLPALLAEVFELRLRPENLTLMQIGSRLGVTAEMVRHREAAAYALVLERFGCPLTVEEVRRQVLEGRAENAPRPKKRENACSHCHRPPVRGRYCKEHMWQPQGCRVCRKRLERPLGQGGRMRTECSNECRILFKRQKRKAATHGR